MQEPQLDPRYSDESLLRALEVHIKYLRKLQRCNEQINDASAAFEHSKKSDSDLQTLEKRLAEVTAEANDRGKDYDPELVQMALKSPINEFKQQHQATIESLQKTAQGLTDALVQTGIENGSLLDVANASEHIKFLVKFPFLWHSRRLEIPESAYQYQKISVDELEDCFEWIRQSQNAQATESEE